MHNREKELVTLKKSTNDRFYGGLVPVLIEKLWDLNPTLFLNVIEELFMRPKAYAVREREKEFMSKANVNHIFIEESFQTITTYEWTHSDPTRPWILFSHGWAARASQLSFLMQGLYEEGFNIVSYDQTAHGNSTGSATNFFDFILVQSKVLNFYPQISMIAAHSMASGAVLANLPTHPWIKKVILISPHRDILQEIGHWFSRAGIQGRLLNEIIEHMSARYNLNFDLIRNQISQSLDNNEILVIHDHNDQECDYKESEKLVREASKAKLFNTEGLGHFRIVKSKMVLEKMADWFGDSRVCKRENH